MVKLPVDDAEKFAMWMLEEFDDDGNTLMVAPGAGFYTEGGLGKQEIRIAYVINKNKLAIGMNCLKKALEVYPGRL